MKICELKIKDSASMYGIIDGLIKNGYKVEIGIMWKEFPQTGIEYFMIAVFNCSADKGGEQQ